jgi:hypothetical protein
MPAQFTSRSIDPYVATAARDHAGPVCAVGHPAGDGHRVRPAAQVLDRLVKRLLGAAGDHHAGAVVDESPGDGQPDPP